MDLKLKRPMNRDLEMLEKLNHQLEEARKINNNARAENKQKENKKLKYEANIFNEDEMIEYIGELMENAFHAKTDIYQDRQSAEVAYKTILWLDRHNPEAAYRYGFL